MQQKRYWYIITAVLCCGMAAASLGLCVNAYGVFLTPVSEALHVTRASVSLHATLFSLAAGFMAPAVNALIPKTGVRKLLFGGVLLTVLSTAGMALAKKIWIFNVLGVLRGIGSACFMLPVITLVMGNWFEKARGTLTGLACSFSGVAGALFSPVFAKWITLWGYEKTYVALAVLIFLFAMPAGLLVRTTPQEVGLAAYGHVDKEEQGSEEEEERGVYPFRILSWAFLLVFAVMGLANAVPSLTTHLSGYAENIGVGTQNGAIMMTCVMIANISSKFLFGVLNDRIGLYKASFLMIGASFTGLVLMLFAGKTLALLFVASALYGTIYSFCAVGCSLVTRDVFGNKQYGKAYSVFSVIFNVSTALVISLIGKIYDTTGHYRAALLLVIGCEAVTLLLLAVTQRITRRRREER
ncbi:MAG: MFS transporter [Clostridia bacterium]|nr:MFS transporter [Clostridia bacterium]